MPIELTFAERRVVGVLIEKAFTTPEQYPLTLNGAVVASNQKSCRDPVSNLDDGQVIESLESLRRKGFTTLVRAEGTRADRWKQRFGETLGLDARETALLAELLLRGPQTDGELRQHTSRMVPYQSLEEVGQVIERLSARPDPLVVRITPPGRKRGVQYAHTFYPALERPADEEDRLAGSPDTAPAQEEDEEALPRAPSPVAPRPSAAPPAPSPAASGACLEDIGLEVRALREELAALTERVEELEATFVKFLK